MPACERCGKWFPPRLGLLECTVCGGRVRSARDDPALRDLVRLTHESRDREERRIDELSRRLGSTAPLTPEERVEYDTLVDRYAVRHGQPRAEIEDWFELRRAQERKAERQWGYVAGLLIVGVADLIPLVALALLVLSPSDVGELDGLAVAATLISTPLVLVGVGLVLDRLYSRLGRTNPDPMGLALIIAWVWAGLFLLMASRLVAWDDLLQASPLGSSRAAEVTLACGLDSAPRLTDRQGPRAVNA